MKNTSLLVSLRDQPVELGARQVKTIEWEVPEGWSTEVLELPAGTSLPIDVAITTIDDGVYVEVSGEAALTGQCIRCLKDIEVSQRFTVTDTFVYPERPGRSRQRRERDDDSIEVTGDEIDPDLVIDRETIDLEPVLRDGVFADAPFKPVCSGDCQGICEHCGILLEDAGPDHHHEFLDPRFEALAGFFDRDKSSDEDEM